MSVNNQAGTVVGNYKILRQLGEGGMGEVFLAERIGIGGRVALKILHRTFVNHPEMAARFFNEARAANSIEHGGIVKVYEYGRLQEGDAFIAMEFLDGQSLRRRLQEQCPLPVDSALRIARQIAAALAAAHDKGIVHRDRSQISISHLRCTARTSQRRRDTDAAPHRSHASPYSYIL